MQHIDALKIGIEGSEYTAIPDILSSGMTFGHLLLELHYRGDNKVELGQAPDLLERVDEDGYRLFNRTPVGRGFCFVHQTILGCSQPLQGII